MIRRSPGSTSLHVLGTIAFIGVAVLLLQWRLRAILASKSQAATTNDLDEAGHRHKSEVEWLGPEVDTDKVKGVGAPDGLSFSRVQAQAHPLPRRDDESSELSRLAGFHPLDMSRRRLLGSGESVASYAPPASSELANLPVERCGYNCQPLQPWMNPPHWNDSFPPSLTPRPTEPVIVMGCGHSGTTLGVALVGKHPNFHLIFHNPLNKETPICMSETFIDEYEQKWLESTRAAGKQRWVAKAPSNICCLGRIFKHFPNARAVFMIRDGRDVLMSLARRYEPFPEFTPSRLLDRWVYDNLMGLYFARDPRVMILRYEDLVQRPVQELKRLFDFVGATSSEQLLSELAGTSGKVPPVRPDAPFSGRKGSEHDRLRDWQVKQGLFDDTQRWRRDGLPAPLRAAFEGNQVARALLYELGYANSTKLDW